MKHPSSREFFAYWDEKRGDARAPDRSEIEPAAVRELLRLGLSAAPIVGDGRKSSSYGVSRRNVDGHTQGDGA